MNAGFALDLREESLTLYDANSNRVDVISWGPQSTAASAQAVLGQIGYSNTSEAPISYIVSDDGETYDDGTTVTFNLGPKPNVLNNEINIRNGTVFYQVYWSIPDWVNTLRFRLLSEEPKSF